MIPEHEAQLNAWLAQAAPIIQRAVADLAALAAATTPPDPTAIEYALSGWQDDMVNTLASEYSILLLVMHGWDEEDEPGQEGD